MDSKKRKICNNLLGFYFNKGKPELDFDCQPFMDLVSTVWEDVKFLNYSDSDITISTVERRISELETIPVDIDTFYNSLIDSTKANFEANISSTSSEPCLPPEKAITFCDGMLCLIPNVNDEKNLFHHLSDAMAIDDHDCFFMFEHTKTSRSPDFFKHNLLLIKIEDQTHSLHSYRGRGV